MSTDSHSNLNGFLNSDEELREYMEAEDDFSTEKQIPENEIAANFIGSRVTRKSTVPSLAEREKGKLGNMLRAQKNDDIVLSLNPVMTSDETVVISNISPTAASSEKVNTVNLIETNNNNNTDVETDEESKEHSETKKESWSVKKRLFLVISSLLLCGVGFYTVAKITGSNITKKADSLSEERKAIKSIIEAAVLDKSTLLESSVSPQLKAHNWILLHDNVLLEKYRTVDEIRQHADLIVQRYVLAVFYFATSGDTQWTGMQYKNWVQGHECERQNGTFWNGINCNSDDRVQTLWLEDIGLMGSIPLEIGHLTELEHLVIRGETGLAGSLPDTIAGLQSLKQLDLSRNGLIGSVPTGVFSSLTEVKLIDVHDNKLSGSIPLEIGQLNALEVLILSGNSFNDTFPFSELSATKIEYLALSQNQFSGTISSSIGLCTTLQYLYLDDNEFYGNVPNETGSLVNLRTLMMGENQFSGTIPANFGSATSLEYWSLESNRLSGSIPTDINRMTSLITLNFGMNMLSDSIPILSNLTSLQNIILSENQLDGDISDKFVELVSLEILVLSSNQFTGNLPVFPYNSTIRGLYLSHNSLSGELAPAVCALSNLQALFLSDNQLNGTIPACVGSLMKLQQFYVSKNMLSGEIPPDFSDLVFLSGLGLDNNNITGEIPESFCFYADEGLLSISADCGGISPLVNCTCCEVCCPSDDERCQPTNKVDL